MASLQRAFGQRIPRRLGNPAAIRRALVRYFRRGRELAEHEELIDALGVSEDLLLAAGFNEAESTEAWRLVTELSQREIDEVSLED